MMHETIRHTRSVGSSSNDRSPAFCAGEIADGSGCVDWLQYLVGLALEGCMEARRRRFLVRSATSWTEFKVVTSATLATVNGFAGGNGRLGLFRVGLDVSPSAGFDSAAVWHRVPRGLRRHAVAQTGLESPKARATCSGTQRAGHSPLAPRRMAAAKKRASNGKLVPLPVQELRATACKC